MSEITSKYGTPDSAAIRRDKKTCYSCKNAYILMISEAIRCDKRNKFIPNGGEAERCKFYSVEGS